MQTEQFSVQKAKCQGCVATICKGLMTVPGVTAVEVHLPMATATSRDSLVEVRGETISRDAIAQRLVALGFALV